MNPILRPKYRMSMEQRVYTQNNDDHSLELVGIPDNVVFTPSSNPSETSSHVAVAPPKVEPLTVSIPQPETVKEWYLQVKKRTGVNEFNPLNRNRFIKER